MAKVPGQRAGAHPLQPLLDALTIRAGLVGENGDLLSANGAWRKARGHPLAGPSLVPGANYLHTLARITGPARDDGQRVATALQRVLEGGSEVLTHTFRYGSPDHAQWSRTSVCPIEGQPRCAAILHEDVTQQVHAQAALKRSQARLRTILTGAPIVLFSLDRDGVFTVVEGMGGTGTGFVTEDLVGRSVHDAYRHMPHLLEIIQDAMVGRVGVITQMVGHIAFEVRCSPIYRRDRIDGVVGVATDVTERLRAQRMKDEFVSIVSHELRTPLTSIRGSLGLLEGGVAGELPPKASDLVRIARSNTDRLIRLINDILDLDKMEAGQVTLQRSAVPVRGLIDEVIGEMSGYAQQMEVAIAVEASHCDPVHADRDRLAQVLTNLLSNAVKFSPAGGQVVVRMETRATRVRISVVDRGPGIAASDIPKLFQKFHQLDASDARSRGGSGLGLVIAKTLVEAHHGQIGVESEVGQGSTFYFELPVSRQRTVTVVPPRVSQSPAVAIDAQAIVAPQQRGTTGLLAELEAHLRDATPADGAKLRDAQATARIMGSTLAADATAELRGAIELVARALDEALQGPERTRPSALETARQNTARIRELLGP
ncbi:MAG: ATP-binding protein [Myxococcota bacterium]